ncbi:unnamed protein product [Closterium sp. NIES-65]|nr:unnamed protein product [Closterium sp. NIES-65]
MTRAYITAIPIGVVMKKAGYSGFTQDYFLGRSRVEPGDELLALIAEHIFPGVDDLLKKAEELAKKGSNADIAAVHFWRTLVMFRRIVAEDLAVKLVRTPWHPYVQYSKLCRIPLFQHWAKRVEKTDTDTIKKRQDPTLIQPEGKGVKGLGKMEVSKLRAARAFVARGFKPETWVANLFPDTWVEQMKKTLADLARENNAGQLPLTHKSTKRKKTA